MLSHVITVVETWLNPDMQIYLKDYSTLRRDRGLVNVNGNYIKGRGVVCFIHNGLKSRLLYSSEAQDVSNWITHSCFINLSKATRTVFDAVHRRL